MDTLIVMTALPHLMDPSPGVRPGRPVQLSCRRRMKSGRLTPPDAPGNETRHHQHSTFRPKEPCGDRFQRKTSPARQLPPRYPGGGTVSLFEVKKGQTLRLLDPRANRAVDTLFYNADNPRGALRRTAQFGAPPEQRLSHPRQRCTPTSVTRC